MAASDPTTNEPWDSMDFAELSKRYAELVQSIKSQIGDLSALGPALKRKAREVGLSIEPDYTELHSALQRLGRVPSERGPRGQGRGRRRGEGKGRPMRFKLVWRDSGEPVVDQTGEPILFRSKVQILRGPRYEALVGRQVDKVQLVDTQRDNQVVVDRLTLGPAPGGHR